MLKQIQLIAIISLFACSFGANAAECKGADSCFQICKVNNVDKKVCARSQSARDSQCKKMNGMLYPAVSRCGWGWNCNGCE